MRLDGVPRVADDRLQSGRLQFADGLSLSRQREQVLNEPFHPLAGRLYRVQVLLVVTLHRERGVPENDVQRPAQVVGDDARELFEALFTLLSGLNVSENPRCPAKLSVRGRQQRHVQFAGNGFAVCRLYRYFELHRLLVGVVQQCPYVSLASLDIVVTDDAVDVFPDEALRVVAGQLLDGVVDEGQRPGFVQRVDRVADGLHYGLVPLQFPLSLLPVGDVTDDADRAGEVSVLVVDDGGLVLVSNPRSVREDGVHLPRSPAVCSLFGE